jgi:hypothetical protein
VDEVDVGPLQLIKHLPRGGAERLDIFPVAFRVERIEGERRLAGATWAGNHDQFTSWDTDLEVLQVVLTGSP